ncbi:MAG: YIP1 family protein [Candidatus Hermodarchaeota archaeon]|nr:YIP1 family protein [Candidatus Hermodarchaeota archaeon]
MFLVSDFKKAWQIIAHPNRLFDEEKTVSGYWPVLRWFLLLNVILAILTPVVSWLGVPANIIHAGTNAQMGAYVYAPLLEATTGLSRYVWVGLLTYLLNVLKFPLIGVIYHVIAKLLRGSGSLLDSFKVGTFAVAPTLVFGWVPYFGLISGLWAGYLYVVALNRLHEVPFGPAIAVINFFIGIQVVWAFTFGWFGSTTPW